MLVECTHCEARVDTKVVGTHNYGAHENGPPGRYTFLVCLRCESPILVHQERWGPDELDEPTSIYPVTFLPSSDLPSGIQAAFQEANNCIKGKAFTAAAIMCRKSLEGACKESGITERNLHQSLLVMKTRGIIDGRLAEWAGILRMVGNEAAHDLEVRVTAVDARDLLEFTRALLDNVFTVKKRFDTFIARRDQASGNARRD